MAVWRAIFGGGAVGKHFGFSGFSELQPIFRENLSRQLAHSRDLIESGSSNLSSPEIAKEFLVGSVAGMQESGQCLVRKNLPHPQICYQCNSCERNIHGG